MKTFLSKYCSNILKLGMLSIYSFVLTANEKLYSSEENTNVVQTEQPAAPAPIQFNALQNEQNKIVVDQQSPRDITINFNNVAIVEYVRFLSKISNKNFIFDEAELQFNVTIVSEEPTSIENLVAALLQELQIRNFSLIEQGNTIIIHQNPKVRSPGKIVFEGAENGNQDTEIITRVFRLNTLDPNKASEIIRPLVSLDALVEVLANSNTIIITDLAANVNKIAQLIRALDSPNGGMQIGHYFVRNGVADAMKAFAEQILQPIAQGNPFVLVSHTTTNSLYIISNPYIVGRAIAIFQYLDANVRQTQILTLDQLTPFEEGTSTTSGTAPTGIPTTTSGTAPGMTEGFTPEAGITPEEAARQLLTPGVLTTGGGAPAVFHPEQRLAPGEISPTTRWARDLPAGHLERTLFYIHKLKYRKGDQVQIALKKIAESLLTSGSINKELVTVINSTEWLESTNSLILTGAVEALERVRELIEEIDAPLRQVFIEVLVLDTTLSDSLQYGVEWGSRFGGGNTSGSQAFLGPFSPLQGALDTAGIGLTPSAAGLARTEGYHLGIIGQHLTHGGLRFNSIGALVTALHNDVRTNIVLNPKIITEDNNPAEIFVGDTVRYKTQSISNDQGSVITNNFQFLDVGTTLRVTPLISNQDIITLEIIQEITSPAPGANITANTTSANDVNLIPVLIKNKTTTKVHVPDGFFVVLSGLIRDQDTRIKRQVPCLGGIPLIGGLNKLKTVLDDKRNLMIFIRPKIIDTDEEMDELTRRQQNIFRAKNKFKRTWNHEVDEALDFLNLLHNEQDEPMLNSFGNDTAY